MGTTSSGADLDAGLLAEMGALALSETTPVGAKPIKKCSYTHLAMIDLIIAHPEMTQNQLAAYFGYTPAWISNVLASDAFQSLLAKRKDEIVDPALKASMEERFRAMTIRSLEVLQAKLNAPQVSDNVALRAAELGAKALGIGGNAPPPPAPAVDRLEKLAQRLLHLRESTTERIIDGQVLETNNVPTAA